MFLKATAKGESEIDQQKTHKEPNRNFTPVNDFIFLTLNLK